MLGKKIREIRNGKKITLTDLAESSELTASYISQIEREIVEPSISSLRRIATALNVPLYTFLDNGTEANCVIKRDKRKKLILPESNVVYEFLSPMAGTGRHTTQLEIIYFQLEPKSWSREDYSYHTQSEECIVVLTGKLTLDFGEESHELETGDSIYISSNTPHRAYNPSDEVTTAIMCLTPPSY